MRGVWGIWMIEFVAFRTTLPPGVNNPRGTNMPFHHVLSGFPAAHADLVTAIVRAIDQPVIQVTAREVSE